MKHLIITALLAVSLFATAPAAKAADWNNDTLSCDIKVTNTFFGKWEHFSTKFYLTAKPEVFLTFECRAINILNTNGYLCYLEGHDGVWNWNATRTNQLVLEFAPGITQKQTCEKMFREFHPTPK